MSQGNFLIGRGELLTRDIVGPKRMPGKAIAYTLGEATQRLAPLANQVALDLDLLPKEACPADFGVALLTLNPSYIAKSYFPSALLRDIGLTSIGSRAVTIKPEKWTKKDPTRECSTTELFVAGKRHAFRNLQNWMQAVEPSSDEADDLTHIESFASFSASSRVVEYANEQNRFFEVGVHLFPGVDSSFIRSGLVGYASKLGIEVYSDLAFTAGNLWFVPIEGELSAIKKIADFSFIRVVRPVPPLRSLRPIQRASSIDVHCQLPLEQPLSSEPKVAILDGGLPDEHPLAQWVGLYRELDPDASADPNGLVHGLAVTSAFLFGPITPGGVAQRPYAYADHLRVLDQGMCSEDPLELYRTLGLIEQVLLSRQYEFINLSLGPDLPIEDADVHAWTSVIDDLLSDGDTFMTVAAGNNGERDRECGFARVQVPADCVNSVAVGAASNTDPGWERASYSAIGPGRSPGVIKPDLMAFGGDPSGKYFHALVPSKKPALAPLLGTSFAAPYLLRSAVGMRAILGRELSPLALKALLIHGADQNGHDKLDVGWGKIPEDVMTLITCPDGVARVIYQGELKPGKYLRASLPLPHGGLTGKVKLKATFCYACSVDPQDAASYTRAGLDITFRPHDGKVKPGKANANSKSFFEKKAYATEEEQRSDMGKWETAMHAEHNMYGSSLNAPVFDIHYNAREGGASTSGAEKIRYALVLTLEAPKHADLYNEILRSYASILTPIQPQVSLPIRT